MIRIKEICEKIVLDDKCKFICNKSHKECTTKICQGCKSYGSIMDSFKGDLIE